MSDGSTSGQQSKTDAGGPRAKCAGALGLLALVLLLACGRIGYDQVWIVDGAGGPPAIDARDPLPEVAAPIDAGDAGLPSDGPEAGLPGAETSDLLLPADRMETGTPPVEPPRPDAGPADVTPVDRPPDEPTPPVDVAAPTPVPPAFAAATDVVQNSDPAQIVSFPHTIGNGADRFLLVAVALETAAVEATAVTYRGQPLTRWFRTGAGACAIEMWYRVGPPTGTGQVAVTRNASSETVAMALSFTGVGAPLPTDPVGVALGQPSPIRAPAAASTSSLVVDLFCLDAADPTAVVGPGQTVRALRTGSTFAGGMSTVVASSGRGSLQWTFNGMADGWVAATVALPPVAR